MFFHSLDRKCAQIYKMRFFKDSTGTLDEDSLHRVLHFSDRPTILAFALVSRNASLMIGPHLTREVALFRSIEQVQDFCRFVLSRNLGSVTRRLVIRDDAARRPDNCAGNKWRQLLELLEEALYKMTNLRSFSLHSNSKPGVHSLSRELPLAQALLSLSSLQYLSVVSVDLPFLSLLRPVRGLRHLGIHVAYHTVQTAFLETQNIVQDMMRNSVGTLSELSLSDIELQSITFNSPQTASCLSSSVRYLTLRHPSIYPPMISLRRLAHAFPNLHHLTLVKSGMLVGTSESALPIKSLKTDSALFPFQAASTTLTHIEFTKELYFTDGSLEWTTFLQSIKDCPITHLSFMIFVRDFDSPCLSQLAVAVPNVEVLDLYVVIAPWIGLQRIFTYVSVSAY